MNPNNLDRIINAMERYDKGQTPLIPFQLHQGLNACITACGGTKGFLDFLYKLRDAELSEIQYEQSQQPTPPKV